MKPSTAAALAALLAAGPAGAIEFKPKLEAEGRWFFQYEAEDAPVTGSAAATVELFHGWDENRQRLVGELFQRYDANDDARTHGDVRELYYQLIGEDFELRLGARRVFWGVTESRHLVDIVNQSDFVENIDNEDKLGQPMMNLALVRDFGTIDVFLLPYQRARTFPGPDGLPRLPYPVVAHEALYESSREQHNLDYAMRYTGSFGPLDFGVAWFNGTAREPRLLPCVRSGASGTYVSNPGARANCDIASTFVAPGPLPPPDPEQIARDFEAEVRANLVLVPYYDRLRQLSIDAQVVTGSLALKVEGLRREQQDRATWAAVTGFEYTLGDVGATGADVGLLAEYLYDERSEFFGVLADDEVFVGSRLALNDVAGTSLLAGVIASREDLDSRLYGIEASGRLNDDWKLSLESRLFSRIPPGQVTSFLADQDFAMLTLERFF
jgi:hypothetical protein